MSKQLQPNTPVNQQILEGNNIRAATAKPTEQRTTYQLNALERKSSGAFTYYTINQPINTPKADKAPTNQQTPHLQNIDK